MTTPILSLDIETVPQREYEDLSPIVHDYVDSRLEKINANREGDDLWDYSKLASLDGDLGKVVCISLGYYKEDTNTIRLKSFCGADETEVLNGFNEVIGSHRGDYLHFNGLGFDIPFILQRMAYNGLEPSDKNITRLARFRTSPHYDLMQVWANWDYTKTKPLTVLADIVGMPNPKDELDGSQVNEYFQKGRLDEIKHYCELDTATVLNMYLHLVELRPVLGMEQYEFSGE